MHPVSAFSLLRVEFAFACRTTTATSHFRERCLSLIWVRSPARFWRQKTEIVDVYLELIGTALRALVLCGHTAHALACFCPGAYYIRRLSRGHAPRSCSSRERERAESTPPPGPRRPVIGPGPGPRAAPPPYSHSHTALPVTSSAHNASSF
jgi:hypothetical protein